MKLDSPQLEALATLNSSPEFKRFITIINDELSKADESLRVTTPETFQRVQGRAQLLAEILHDVATAQGRLFALKNK